jgi:peptidoglycan-associated lipoprotein
MKIKILMIGVMAAALLSGCSSTKEDPSAMGGNTAGFNGGGADHVTNPLSTNVVYFELDKDIVRQDYMGVVAAHAREAASQGKAVRLEGHADELGSREYNIGLGDRRARAVKQLMGSYGMPSSNIKTVSYGEERPVVVTGGSHEKNRRVEIKY